MNCQRKKTNNDRKFVSSWVGLGQKKRNKNTLGELAKNFFEFIKEDSGKVFRIDDIVRKLHISKRRIYDITNVLEGNFTY